MQHLMTLAAVTVTGGGDGIIGQMVSLLLFALCFGIVYGLGWLLFKRFPPLWLLIWNGIFVLIGGLLLINFLLSLGGHPIFHW